MISIYFVTPAGEQTAIQTAPGVSLMQTAVNYGVGGIVGECGGSGICATCHVYVDEAWADRIEPISEIENELLECAGAPRRKNSRLACQIRVSAEIDGIVVHLPESQ